MGGVVSKPDHFFPGDFGMGVSDVLGNIFSGLTDDLKISDHGINDQLIFFEGLQGKPGDIPFNFVHGLKDVGDKHFMISVHA